MLFIYTIYQLYYSSYNIEFMTRSSLIAPPSSRLVTCWLILLLALVANMVLVGGYTRLSGSGMSITEWKPIHGVIPPLNETEWTEEFDKYRQIPQYQLINKGMSLDEFKAIFWPEFWHRILGRIVGLAFVVPLICLVALKQISRPLALRMLGIGSLVGLQGFMGWYMVASGLVENTHVSHLRLAAHLSLAFIIFGALLWTLLDVSFPRRRESFREWTPAFAGVTVWFLLLFLQIIYGAFMAGTHAGLLYDSYPTMNGSWMPPESWHMQPIVLNLFENPTAIHFIHRTLAIFLVLGFASWWFFNRNALQPIKLYVWIVAGLLALQFLLGVLTIINAVPLTFALKHQMAGLALYGASVVLMYKVVKS